MRHVAVALAECCVSATSIISFISGKQVIQQRKKFKNTAKKCWQTLNNHYVIINFQPAYGTISLL